MLPELFRRILRVKKSLESRVTLQFIFVDDGSTDKTFSLLCQFAKECQGTQILRLSRNFGHQVAISAGIETSQGDYVAIIDADLQDPPELIIDMYDMAISGYDVVYGQRSRRKSETIFKKVTAYLFYRLFIYICDVKIPRDTGDFRLISRRVADIFSQMPEKRRFVRGMIPWIGFPSQAILYDRDERFAGTTKYPVAKMIKFAIDAVLSFSNKPILLATNLGAVLIVFGLFGLLYIMILKLLTDVVALGLTTIVALIVLFGGAQIFLIGVIGAYVGRTFEQTKERPLYIIQDHINHR